MIPFIDTSVTRLGTIGCCQMVNVMGVLYNCTSLVPSLRMQVFTAAVYTVYRAYVFSMISTFNAQVRAACVLAPVGECSSASKPWCGCGWYKRTSWRAVWVCQEYGLARL